MFSSTFLRPLRWATFILFGAEGLDPRFPHRASLVPRVSNIDPVRRTPLLERVPTTYPTPRKSAGPLPAALARLHQRPALSGKASGATRRDLRVALRPAPEARLPSLPRTAPGCPASIPSLHAFSAHSECRMGFSFFESSHLKVYPRFLQCCYLFILAVCSLILIARLIGRGSFC